MSNKNRKLKLKTVIHLSKEVDFMISRDFIFNDQSVENFDGYPS